MLPLTQVANTEDQSYPHRRFSKVGGVSEPELGRLEVSFCFITNFELKVDMEMLSGHAKAIEDGKALRHIQDEIQPSIPLAKEPRSIVVGQTKPSMTVAQEAPATS